MYIEHQCLKAKSECAQQILLHAMQKRFGIKSDLEEKVKTLQAVGSLTNLFDLLLDAVDENSFRNQLDEITRH